jgi:hypothetical protein
MVEITYKVKCTSDNLLSHISIRRILQTKVDFAQEGEVEAYSLTLYLCLGYNILRYNTSSYLDIMTYRTG